MSRSVTLVGLDCGSTTCCAVVAQARIMQAALERVELTDLTEVYRSPLEFTPFVDSRIDESRLSEMLDGWLAEAGVRESEIFGGGALITGLAAERSNAAAVTQLVEARLAQAVIAMADAPRLESWLAFMGNCHALSVAEPDIPLLNLDIGGGTTNVALGRAGQVLATGSLYVGARHVEFEPGTYRLRRTSQVGADLLTQLGLLHKPGTTLAATEVQSLVGYYLNLLVAAVEGRLDNLPGPLERQHVQTAFSVPADGDLRSAPLTLSGGVGQLVYQLRAGAGPAAEPSRSITPFGDLGCELARAIASCEPLARRLTVTPEGLGRATVFGLLRHSTELSGSTLFLPCPERLPLANVPIVGRLTVDASETEVGRLLDLAAAGPQAVALQVDLGRQDLAELRRLAQQLSAALSQSGLPRKTWVLLVPANLGKALGQYVTQWGTLDVDLIVIDEVPLGDFQFVRLGRLRDTVVPLWLYAAR